MQSRGSLPKDQAVAYELGEDPASGGVTTDMVRLCAGIEDIEDIIADPGQALAAA